MRFDSIKLIIFIFTLILLSYNQLYHIIKYRTKSDYLIASVVITLLLILIIAYKPHHFLRTKLDIPNTVTYFVFVVPIIYHFYRFKKIIQDTKYFNLIISIIFLGSALLLDLATDAKIIILSRSDLIEEFLRILGASFWFWYYVQCVKIIKNADYNVTIL